MALATINFIDVMTWYKGYQGQKEALDWLGTNLTTEQLNAFYIRWYSDGKKQPAPEECDARCKFDMIYPFTKQYEGGFVDHPSDPGGRTNFGITQATYDEIYRAHGIAAPDVYYLTPDEAEDIYYEHYFLSTPYAYLCAPLAGVLFDTGVNFGVGGAIQFLQEAVGVTSDGVFGAVSKQATDRQDNVHTARAIIYARQEYRYSRVRQNPSQDVFLEGWLNRDNALETWLDSIV